MQLTQDGKIWLALCVVSLSSSASMGNIKIIRKGKSEYLQFDLSTKKFNECQSITLSEYEKNVLSLSLQGFTMNEISNAMHKSIDTIKYYKRQIFEKTETESISSAISYAVNNKLL